MISRPGELAGLALSGQEQGLFSERPKGYTDMLFDDIVNGVNC